METAREAVKQGTSIKVARRWLMAGAIGIFLFTALMGIILNSTVMGYGFHAEYSISRYVGLETWSAILFGLGNVVTMVLLLYYLYEMGENLKMPRIYFWLVVLMAAGLIGLLSCPVGYFDLPGAPYASSAPSKVHEIGSRLMFLAMLVSEMIVLSSGLIDKRTRIFSVVFVIYGLICVFGYLTKATWFLNALVFFEMMYLLSFMVICLVSRRKVQSDE